MLDAVLPSIKQMITNIKLKYHSIGYNKQSTSIRFKVNSLDEAVAIQSMLSNVVVALHQKLVAATTRIQNQKVNVYVILRIKAVRE